MNSRQRNISYIQNEILKPLIYSWDYFHMDFPHHYIGREAPKYYVPNGLIELVITKDLQVYEAKFNQPLKQLAQSFIWGQTKHGNRVVISGKGKWFEVKLYPYAFELLFGHSANSLTSGGIPTKEINPNFDILIEQINSIQSGIKAIHLFEKFAIQQIKNNKTVQPFLIHSFHQILRTHGQVKISDLCTKMNVSRQYFHQYFKDKIGLSPKAYSKILRLRFAVDLLYTDKNKSNSQVALESGYFDQAHFINDFKDILHQTPSTFFGQKQFIYWDMS